MTRNDLVAFLSDEIIRRKPENRPLRVAIDGRCASGKTILADGLASALASKEIPALRPSIDGFHHSRERRYQKGEYSAAGYYEDAYNYQAVIDHLLAPLSGSVFPVMCRQVAHDVRTDMPDSAPPVSVEASSILLFDGVFLFRRELNAYWDFRILLDIDASTSLSRAVERDTDVIGSAEVVRRKYELRYEPAWQIYLHQEHPETNADVVVDNRDFLKPRILKPQNSSIRISDR